MFNIEMAFISKVKWCVYAHYDLYENLVYIGMGAPHRAFTRERRTMKWHTVLGDGFYVSILSWHDTKAEAEAEETKRIKEFKPACNVIHTGRAMPHIVGNKWNLGRRHTDEAKKIMSEKQKASWLKTRRITGTRKPTKPIRCIETGIIYPSLRETAKQMGMCPSAISSQINGRLKHTRGYTFTREG